MINSRWLVKGDSMAFIADSENNRTYDPTQGLELRRGDQPTGSSGWLSYKIVGNEDALPFLAQLASIKSVFQLNIGDEENQPCWVIMARGRLQGDDGLGRRRIIADAMLAYKHVHGKAQPHWVYRVVFQLPSGALIDAEGEVARG